MANVRLWLNRRENAVLDLPRVCMKCGAPSTTVKMRTFAWCPPWARMWGILALIMTKRQRVEVPFCAQHKNHFLWRVLGVLGGLAGLLALGAVLGVITAAVAGQHNGPNNSDPAAFLCAGWFVLLLVFAVAIGIYNYMTTIRCTLISDREIGLANVSDEFARAVEEDDEEAARELDETRDRWREPRRGDRRDDDERFQRRSDRPAPRRPSDPADDE